MFPLVNLMCTSKYIEIIINFNVRVASSFKMVKKLNIFIKLLPTVSKRIIKEYLH